MAWKMPPPSLLCFQENTGYLQALTAGDRRPLCRSYLDTMIANPDEFLAAGAWRAQFLPGRNTVFSVTRFNLVGDGLRDGMAPPLTRDTWPPVPVARYCPASIPSTPGASALLTLSVNPFLPICGILAGVL
jgi:hypothetical protein